MIRIWPPLRGGRPDVESDIASVKRTSIAAGAVMVLSLFRSRSLAFRVAAGLVVLWAVAGTGLGTAQPAALTTGREVAESYLLPSPRPSVQLEAVITGRYPNGTILVRDETGPTFVIPENQTVSVAPGDRVRVRERRGECPPPPAAALPLRA